MKRGAAFVVFVGVFALAQAAPTPEAVTIKMKTSGEGDSVLIASNETMKSKMKLVDGQGKVVFESNEDTTTIAEYRETILKRDGKKPATKLEREYTKAQKRTGDKTEDLGLSGQTVLIEKKDDKYTFTDKNGKGLMGAAAETLTKEFSSKGNSAAELEQLMLPKGAVKPGEEWKLDVEKVMKEFDKDGGGSDVDLTKAIATGKLLKVYTKDGKQFGEMEFKLEAPIKAIGKGAEQMKFADGAKMVMNMSMDVCIDGTADIGTMKMKMGLRGTASLASMPGSTMTLDINGDGVQTQKEPAKK